MAPTEVEQAVGRGNSLTAASQWLPLTAHAPVSLNVLITSKDAGPWDSGRRDGKQLCACRALSSQEFKGITQNLHARLWWMSQASCPNLLHVTTRAHTHANTRTTMHN